MAVSEGKYTRYGLLIFSQGGKSKLLENLVGQKLDTDPEPILYIGPTKANVTKVVEPKIDDMLRRCKSLAEKTLFGQSYTKTSKKIAGTLFRFAWAGSTTEIKAASAALVIVDELDEISIETKGQGSIIELADARHGTYPNGITVTVSTCTQGTVTAEVNPDTKLEHWVVSKKVSSAIWIFWQQGTRHEWAWPCPHCGEYFIPRFKHLRWPENATSVSVLKSAYIACPNNGCVIEDRERAGMNARGVAVSPGQKINRKGKVTGKGVASTDYTLWASGLCNPFKSIGLLASKWLRATHSLDSDAIAAVLNTDFAELYSTGGEAPTENAVKLCCINYQKGEVNEKIRVITVGVDVQGNRLEYVVRGWAYQWESYLIDEGVIWGDTDQDEVWTALEHFLNTDFEDRPINLMLIDSGYNSLKVYEFVRNNKARTRAVKGRDALDKPFYGAKIDVTPRKGKVIKNGLMLWHFDTDTVKTWVHARVNRKKDLPGQWYLPINVSDDYCKQIIAEERIEKASGGVTWKQVAKDNHKLDAEGMAYLGALMLSSRITAKDKPDTPDKKPEKTTPEKSLRKKRAAARRRGNKPAWRRV